MALKSRFSGLFTQFQAMMGGQVSPRSILIVLNVLNTRCNAQMPSEEMLLGKLEQTREVIERVNLTFKATPSSKVTALAVGQSNIAPMY